MFQQIFYRHFDHKVVKPYFVQISILFYGKHRRYVRALDNALQSGNRRGNFVVFKHVFYKARIAEIDENFSVVICNRKRFFVYTERKREIDKGKKVRIFVVHQLVEIGSRAEFQRHFDAVDGYASAERNSADEIGFKQSRNYFFAVFVCRFFLGRLNFGRSFGHGGVERFRIRNRNVFVEIGESHLVVFFARQTAEHRNVDVVFAFIREFNGRVIACYRKRENSVVGENGIVFQPAEFLHLLEQKNVSLVFVEDDFYFVIAVLGYGRLGVHNRFIIENVSAEKFVGRYPVYFFIGERGGIRDFSAVISVSDIIALRKSLVSDRNEF